MHYPKPRVLIVDDQPSIRRTMTVVIENFGCQTVDVEDGYHAIERVRSQKFDLIFLDIKMPGINGVQTFREIKKIRPESLVVVMTGFDVKELIDAAVEEGVLSVVLKPFEPKQIVQLLKVVNSACLKKLPPSIVAKADKVQDELESIVREFSLARMAVRVPDRKLRALRLLAASGPASDLTQPLVSYAGMGGAAFYKNEVQISNDHDLFPLVFETEIELGVKSSMAMPIRSESSWVLGSVAMSSYEPNYFGQEVVSKIREISKALGNIMESPDSQNSDGMGRVKIRAA